VLHTSLSFAATRWNGTRWTNGAASACGRRRQRLVKLTGAASLRAALLGVILGLVLGGIPGSSASATEAGRPSVALPSIDDPQTREILANPTLRQHITRIRFPGDRRTYEFLVSHPPLATQLARRLHPSLERYTVTQVAEGFYTVEDRGALRGEARLIQVTNGQRVYRVEGEFRSLANLLRFTGRMVLVLDYREVREGGRTYIESDPDFYLRIDHLFYGFMAKLLTPLFRFLIERRVNMIVEASTKLFEQVVKDPERLYQEMATWREVRPEDLEAYRQAFVSKDSTGRR